MIKLFEQFNNEQEIHDICKQYNIKNYTINDDGSIDVNGSVLLNRKKLSKLPLHFKKVSGGFSCRENKLTTLEGCPEYVGGYFNCSHNKLSSLKGCPKYVGGHFDINDNININRIDIECDIKGSILLGYVGLNLDIINLKEYYIKMLFKHGLDYNIFNIDGTINDSRLNHFLNDFK